jgi:hypothetical protein
MKRTTIFIVTLCLAGITLFINPSPAAAAGCYGIRCQGRDPQLMGCWRDARTIGISPLPGTAAAGWNEVVELRYSRACAAQWSRVRSRFTSGISYTTAYHLANPTLTRVTVYGGTYVWSKMYAAVYDIGGACGNTVLKADPTYKPTHCVDPNLSE